jgi:exopolyphosphatase/guanosine-5'-triphosphate,3'-diphosphate pyrophosphatase
MTVASIDIGTNTFDLLILSQDQGFKVVYSEKRWIGLGYGLYENNLLSQESLSNANHCLRGFYSQCQDYNVEKIRIVATSALRDATNGEEWIQEIFNELGWNIEIISGKEEATMVLKGHQRIFSITKSALIMDVGGGSTEFTFFNHSSNPYSYSCDIGVSRLQQLWPLNNPLTEKDIKTLMNFLNENVTHFSDQSHGLIGASGVFESLFQLTTHQNLEPFHLNPVPLKDFTVILETLIKSEASERQVLPILPVERKSYIHLAALQILFIIQKYKVDQIFVTNCGLSESLALELMEEQST